MFSSILQTTCWQQRPESPENLVLKAQPCQITRKETVIITVKDTKRSKKQSVQVFLYAWTIHNLPREKWDDLLSASLCMYSTHPLPAIPSGLLKHKSFQWGILYSPEDPFCPLGPWYSGLYSHGYPNHKWLNSGYNILEQGCCKLQHWKPEWLVAMDSAIPSSSDLKLRNGCEKMPQLDI